MSLPDVFNEAAQHVKELPSASNEDKLELYSFFKQANEGDCTTGMYGLWMEFGFL